MGITLMGFTVACGQQQYWTHIFFRANTLLGHAQTMYLWHTLNAKMILHVEAIEHLDGEIPPMPYDFEFITVEYRWV